MKVVLLGNIGVGKTTIANIIREKWRSAEILSIDNIRKSFGGGTVEKENFCKKKFIDSVTMDNALQIIELTGVGVLGERLFKILSKYDYSILVIYLFVSESEIFKRIKNRKWDTPFPFKFDKVPDAIYYTNQEYEKGLLDKFTHECKSAVYLALQNSNVQLHRNIKIIINILKVLM